MLDTRPSSFIAWEGGYIACSMSNFCDVCVLNGCDYGCGI